MHRFFSKFKKQKKTSMAEEPPTTPASAGPVELESVEEPVAAAAAAAAAAVAPVAPPTVEQTALFMEAYECAKNNYQWNKVALAISNHPDWLTRIPHGRKWTMLHQIVYCGNVPHLNEVLTFEITNEEFRLLCKSLDDKTVREVASERAHIYPQMLRRIERLVAIDQMLNNARDGKWELVKQLLRQQGEIVNEKPPYRKQYLAHYLASTGQLNMFKELSSICEFRLNLVAENKTINIVARENNFIEFAEHVEQLCPNINEAMGESEPVTPSTADSDLPSTTAHSLFSHGFHDDPGIMIFSMNSDPFGAMLLSSGSSIVHMNGSHTWSNYQPQPSTGAAAASHAHFVDDDVEPVMSKKSEANIPPPMTEEEQANYEKAVTSSIKKFSADNLLGSAVTCCITKTILRDPVVAADGFTYEREAILSWFKQSNRSPMTNQELSSQELNPNHAIKSILQSLADSSPLEKN